LIDSTSNPAAISIGWLNQFVSDDKAVDWVAVAVAVSKSAHPETDTPRDAVRHAAHIIPDGRLSIEVPLANRSPLRNTLEKSQSDRSARSRAVPMHRIECNSRGGT
jgi:hypothetical protein